MKSRPHLLIWSQLCRAFLSRTEPVLLNSPTRLPAKTFGVKSQLAKAFGVPSAARDCNSCNPNFLSHRFTQIKHRFSGGPSVSICVHLWQDNFRALIQRSARRLQSKHGVACTQGGSAAPRTMLSKCGFAAIVGIEQGTARSTTAGRRAD